MTGNHHHNSICRMKKTVTQKKRCLRCDYKWGTRKQDPKTCPRCKSYQWAKPKTAA